VWQRKRAASRRTELLQQSRAEAHTLQIQCKKLNAADVVCRGLFTDGEVARGQTIQLLDENSGRVLATGKTDVEGKYAFKAPSAEYSVVIQVSKAEVTSMSSEDIW
jgi:hypothetical protein